MGVVAAADGDLDLVWPVHLRGSGSAATAIDGAGVHRVFEVLLPVITVEVFGDKTSGFQDLTITGGAAGAENGGGVLAQDALRVERVVFESNTAAKGAAVSALVGTTGGDHLLHLVDTTVRDHTTPLAVFGANVRIERSAILNNAQSGGEAYRLVALNSTFSGNSNYNAGAFFAGQAVLDSSTIIDNSENSTGGVFLLELPAIRSTIFANNRNAGGALAHCSVNPNGSVSLGFNIIDDDGSDCALDHPTDQVNTDPLLGALAANGGPTLSHLPDAGSPAIDLGDDANCPAVDQRGQPRPVDGDASGGPACDVGAVEVVPEPGTALGLLAGAVLLGRLRRRRE